MPNDLSQSCRDLLDYQSGMISRKQCTEQGVTETDLHNYLRSGRWRTERRGVYATFTGELSREAELWAALLRIDPFGKHSAFSHQTAAELYQLVKEPSSLIHVTVPAGMNVERHGGLPGISVHRCRRIDRVRHPSLQPPRTRIEETILDLVEVAERAGNFDRAFHWICVALGDKRTTPDRLRDALEKRNRFPERRGIELMLGDSSEGIQSWLEMLYVRGVERAHQLPVAARQAKTRRGARNMYLDNLYEEYQLCVELDGVAAHSGAQQLRDKRRDRHNAAECKLLTLRFGYPDLRTQEDRCSAAAEVSRVLSGRGPKTGVACERPGCPV